MFFGWLNISSHVTVAGPQPSTMFFSRPHKLLQLDISKAFFGSHISPPKVGSCSMIRWRVRCPLQLVQSPQLSHWLHLQSLATWRTNWMLKKQLKKHPETTSWKKKQTHVENGETDHFTHIIMIIFICLLFSWKEVVILTECFRSQHWRPASTGQAPKLQPLIKLKFPAHKMPPFFEACNTWSAKTLMFQSITWMCWWKCWLAIC